MGNAYRLTVETDHRLIKGEEISSQERADIAAALLQEAHPFTPVQADGKREMYPVFYVPGEGVKVRSLLGQTAKTKILAGNMFELEILRLLCLLASEDPKTALMREETLRRLKTTCFGFMDDGQGECFDASLVVLRFLCAAAPEDTEWIKSRVENYNRHVDEKKRPWYSLWYFWLCLSEMPMEIAGPEIEKHRKNLEFQLRRSLVMNHEPDRTVHPVILCMVRNLMARLPEYHWLKGRGVYTSPKDGRLRLDLERGADGNGI